MKASLQAITSYPEPIPCMGGLRRSGVVGKRRLRGRVSRDGSLVGRAQEGLGWCEEVLGL
jgi:hypothetical protein